jgi:hypothetical protein
MDERGWAERETRFDDAIGCETFRASYRLLLSTSDEYWSTTLPVTSRLPALATPHNLCHVLTTSSDQPFVRPIFKNSNLAENSRGRKTWHCCLPKGKLHAFPLSYGFI